jgi:hypothetical protein
VAGLVGNGAAALAEHLYFHAGEAVFVWPLHAITVGIDPNDVANGVGRAPGCSALIDVGGRKARCAQARQGQQAAERPHGPPTDET